MGSYAGPKRKLPLCLSAVAMLLKKKKLKMPNDIHIFGRTVMCPIKQNLIRKKPPESDFPVHARTSRIRVYFLKPLSLI